jgi:hypothetical protein
MKVLLKNFKRVIPAPLKRAIKEARLNRQLRRAVQRIADLPPGTIPSAQMLIDLQTGWDNDGFAARTDYLKEVFQRATTVSGPILECGSGLTTILLGLVAGRRGIKTFSLEHHAEWRTRVMNVLAQFQLQNVQVCLAPLRDYDGFSWYDPPFADLPVDFELVICDGPPGETRGGRYGFWPVFAEHLSKSSVILLDDTQRSGEAEVLRRWAAEADLTVAERQTADSSFAIITRNESTSPRAFPQTPTLQGGQLG